MARAPLQSRWTCASSRTRSLSTGTLPCTTQIATCQPWPPGNAHGLLGNTGLVAMDVQKRRACCHGISGKSSTVRVRCMEHAIVLHLLLLLLNAPYVEDDIGQFVLAVESQRSFPREIRQLIKKFLTPKMYSIVAATHNTHPP